MVNVPDRRADCRLATVYLDGSIGDFCSAASILIHLIGVLGTLIDLRASPQPSTPETLDPFLAGFA